MVTETSMPVSVKVYYSRGSAMEIRRFNFRPDDPRQKTGIYGNLLERIRALYNGLNLHEFNLCWRDDDGDYVVFSSDDELKVALNSVTDNTLRIYIKERQILPPNQMLIAANDSDASVGITPGSSSAGGAVTLRDWTSRGREREPINCLDVMRKPTSAGNKDPHHRREQTPQRSFSVRKSQNLSEQTDQLEIITDSVSGLIVNCNHVDSGLPNSLPSSNPASGGQQASGSSFDDNNGNICGECGSETSARGVWYRCTTCTNYFLCSSCESYGRHDRHIVMRVLPTPNSAAMPGINNPNSAAGKQQSNLHLHQGLVGHQQQFNASNTNSTSASNHQPNSRPNSNSPCAMPFLSEHSTDSSSQYPQADNSSLSIGKLLMQSNLQGSDPSCNKWKAGKYDSLFTNKCRYDHIASSRNNSSCCTAASISSSDNIGDDNKFDSLTNMLTSFDSMLGFALISVCLALLYSVLVNIVSAFAWPPLD